nr:sugar ABC transporter permease [uncultured Devosia sp.]
MRAKTSVLGLAFVSPALLLLIAFFFMPVVLTTYFAFTNMSTATGITGGSHVITGNLLRDLNNGGLDEDIVAALSEGSFSVNVETIAAAAEAGVAPKFLGEIEVRLMGQSFADSRSFEAALKTLSSRPTRVRDLKLATEPFERSILNTRYQSRDAMEAAITGMVPDMAPAMVSQISEASYTGWRWIDWRNFTTLIDRPETVRIILNTAFYVVATLSFTVLMGLFLAITTFYLPRKGATFFSALWLLPRITPVVLYAVMWKWFTWDNGFLYIFAEAVGLPAFNYMKGSVPSAWTIIILVNGFVGASFAMILFSGALRAIPVQQLWASEVDGASRWQQIRRIILPQLRWPILFVTSYQTLSLLSSYEQIWLTTNGGPGSTTTVWALQAFNTALNNYTGNLEYGMGAAMALILVIVGFALSILYLRVFKFDELVNKPKIEF